MHKYGFVKCGATTIKTSVASPKDNTVEIKKMIDVAYAKDVDVLCFSELTISGYTCGDLFFQESLLDECEECIKEIALHSSSKNMLIALGSPVKFKDSIYNCAILINNGKVLGIVPKTYLPNYKEFYEKRWFKGFSLNNPTDCGLIGFAGFEVPFGANQIFQCEEMPSLKVGVEICEDLWAPISRGTILALNGANVILNLSASNETVGKSDYRRQLVISSSASNNVGYVYADAGWGESTTDTMFAGDNLIAENGTLLARNKRFLKEGNLIASHVDVEKIEKERVVSNVFSTSREQFEDRNFIISPFNLSQKETELRYPVSQHPFIPSNLKNRQLVCEEIFNIQVNALAQRFNHIKSKSLVIGVSGGLDSTLALLVCSKVCKKLNLNPNIITAITMPGFGTTGRTHKNAVSLINALGAKFKQIPISNACMSHFYDIGQDPNTHDVTYENAQARERTQILMDVANMTGGMVVGTGDLSELALGWATYNGDHMSMYGVNAGIPKTLIKYLVEWVGDSEGGALKQLLYSITNTPISPELLPPTKDGKIAQKTEDNVGKYELQDFFLFYVMRYQFSPEKIFYLARKAFKEKYEDKYILECLKLFYTRFFTNQFKRSCLPDGVKVGSVTLSPRADFRMPSDASFNLWIEKVKELETQLEQETIKDK